MLLRHAVHRRPEAAVLQVRHARLEVQLISGRSGRWKGSELDFIVEVDGSAVVGEKVGRRSVV